MADDQIVVLEETHHWIDFTLQDQAGTNLSTANIASMFMTIYLQGTATDLFPRADVRNGGAWTSGVTIPTAGTLTIKLEPTWNAIAGVSTNQFENHVILIEGTTAGTPSHTFAREFVYKVQNLTRIT